MIFITQKCYHKLNKKTAQKASDTWQNSNDRKSVDYIGSDIVGYFGRPYLVVRLFITKKPHLIA